MVAIDKGEAGENQVSLSERRESSWTPSEVLEESSPFGYVHLAAGVNHSAAWLRRSPMSDDIDLMARGAF